MVVNLFPGLSSRNKRKHIIKILQILSTLQQMRGERGK